MYTRKSIVKAMKFHLREWNFLGNEVRSNFQNEPKNYLAWLVKGHPVLNLRNY
jgi:hypothetical protein